LLVSTRASKACGAFVVQNEELGSKSAERASAGDNDELCRRTHAEESAATRLIAVTNRRVIAGKLVCAASTR